MFVESGGAMFTNSQFNEYLPDISICFDDNHSVSPKAASGSNWAIQIENQFKDRSGMTLLKTACAELQAAASRTDMSKTIADSVRSRAGLGTVSKLFASF